MSQPTSRRLPASMIVVGVLLGIVGAIVMGVASNRHDEAMMVNGFRRAMGNPFDDPAVAAAVTMGHWGLGLLIAGAAVVLMGVTALAVRR